jgi:vacuolar protein sorting-associated protein 33A
LLPGGEEGANL